MVGKRLDLDDRCVHDGGTDEFGLGVKSYQ